jgi:hypothetical protein
MAINATNNSATVTMTVNAAFDPTDLKYQADPKYLPDKESSWPYAKEEEGMCVYMFACEDVCVCEE